MDTIVYRGMGITTGARLAALGEGSIFSDDGYSSTSLNAAVSTWFATRGGGAVARIFAKKGSKGLYLNDVRSKDGKALTRVLGETELLLPRGSRYRVLGQTKIDNKDDVLNNITVVDLELL